MVLVLFTTAAMAVLWSIMQDRDRTRAWKPLLLWTLTGLGVLTKGPITPLVVVTCLVVVAATTRSLRPAAGVRPVLGVVVVVAVAAVASGGDGSRGPGRVLAAGLRRDARPFDGGQGRTLGPAGVSPVAVAAAALPRVAGDRRRAGGCLASRQGGRRSGDRAMSQVNSRPYRPRSS
jgi:hypothetical protein